MSGKRETRPSLYSRRVALSSKCLPRERSVQQWSLHANVRKLQPMTTLHPSRLAGCMNASASLPSADSSAPSSAALCRLYTGHSLHSSILTAFVWGRGGAGDPYTKHRETGPGVHLHTVPVHEYLQSSVAPPVARPLLSSWSVHCVHTHSAPLRVPPLVGARAIRSSRRGLSGWCLLLSAPFGRSCLRGVCCCPLVALAPIFVVSVV